MRFHVFFMSLFAIILILAIASLSHAYWQVGGISVATGAGRPNAVADTNGGVIVVWQQGPSAVGTYIQGVNADATFRWNLPVQLSSAQAARITPQLVTVGQDTWVAAWVDSNGASDNSIKVARIDAAGTIEALAIIAIPTRPTSLTRTLSLAASDYGGITIAWANGNDAYLVRLDSSLSPTFDDQLNGMGSTYPPQPRVVNDAVDGETFVFLGDNGTIKTRKANQSGWVSATVAVDVPTDDGLYSLPGVEADGTGGVFIAATGLVNGVRKLVVQHQDANQVNLWNGQSKGMFVCPSCSGTESYPAIATDSDNKFVVTWKEGVLKAQKIGSAGTLEWGSTGKDVTNTIVKGICRVAPVSGGGVTVVWRSDPGSADGFLGVRAQTLSSSGNPFWTSPPQGPQVDLASYLTPEQAGALVLVPENHGGAFVVWSTASGAILANRLVRITDPTTDPATTAELLENYYYYKATVSYQVLGGPTGALIKHGPPDCNGNYALAFADVFSPAAYHHDVLVDDGNMPKCNKSSAHGIYNLDPCTEYYYTVIPGGLPVYSGTFVLQPDYHHPRSLSAEAPGFSITDNHIFSGSYATPSFEIAENAVRCEGRRDSSPQTCPDSISLPTISHDRRMGSNSIRFRAAPCNGIVQWSQFALAHLIPFRETRFTGFSLKVTTDGLLPDIEGSFTQIAEWWSDQEVGPPMQLTLAKPASALHLQLRVRNEDHYSLLGCNSPCVYGTPIIIETTIPENVWVDVVIEYRADPSGCGYATMWVDRQKIGVPNEPTYAGAIGFPEPWAPRECPGPYDSSCFGFDQACNAPEYSYYSDDVRQQLRDNSFGIYRRNQLGVLNVRFDELAFSDVKADVWIPRVKISDDVLCPAYDSGTNEWSVDYSFATDTTIAATIKYRHVDCNDNCPSFTDSVVSPSALLHTGTLTAGLSEPGKYCYRIETRVGAEKPTHIEGSFVLDVVGESPIYDVEYSFDPSTCRANVTWKTKFLSQNNKLLYRKLGKSTWLTKVAGSNSHCYSAGFPQMGPMQYKVQTTIGSATYETPILLDESLCYQPQEVSPQPTVQRKTMFLRAHPNPFNPAVTLEYGVVGNEHAELTIFGPDGATVKRLVHEKRAPGEYSINWDGTDQQGRQLPSGVYFARLRIGRKTLSSKLVLMK